MSIATPVTLSPELRRYRIISKKELRALVPYCDQHVLRLEKARRFPRRILLGENRVGWYEHEIIAWIVSRPVREYPATDDDMT